MPADRSRASRQDSAAAPDAHLLSASLLPPMTSGGIAFAPNVTPGTFNDPPPLLDDSDLPSESLLFPPQSDDALPPRKSVHGRKKPENHIPRPPNAFILFRSAFIRSQHVSTGVETNHSTLSKIIGLTWQNLPNEERQIWHRKAKLAEEQHRIKFPQYAFKPLHSKTKGGKRKVREVGPKDQKRCAKIAELLVQGKKGQELDDAIKEFDKTHVPQVVMRFEAPITEQSFKRCVSAPISEARPASSRKLRACSSPTSRRSTPTVSCSSPSPSPASPQPSVPSQDIEPSHSFFSVPSFDHLSFPMKGDPLFDFNSFSFNAGTPPPLPSFPFNPHSQPINPLDNAFSHSPSQCDSIPELRVDTSFIDGPWSPPCDSPCSPSTNSMPTTPAYPVNALPEETYGGYHHAEAPPEYSLHAKSMSNGSQSHFGAYQGTPSMYSSAGQYTDPHCTYSTMPLEGAHPQAHPTHLNYSSFITTLPPYSL